ncbi:MAG: aryl-sulfate sulfotransferase [Planctomycetes bacterium]|nr:aryl-sulfate sulfotransferase [Planctomycetota bacterium]
MQQPLSTPARPRDASDLAGSPPLSGKAAQRAGSAAVTRPGRRVRSGSGAFKLLAMVLSCLGASCTRATPQDATATQAAASVPSPGAASPAAGDRPPPDLTRVMSAPELEAASNPVGLVRKTAAATPGYTLVAPLNSRRVHLVDLDGAVVHTWETGFAPGGWCYLLGDGTLLYCGRIDEEPQFRGGGIGGALRRFAPDGSVVWRYDLADASRWQHHDVAPMPNGNVLVLAWVRQTRAEAIARGRDPRGVGEVGLWPDSVFEIRPTLPAGGAIVWEWHAWDHLVQEVDPTKPNHGRRADHPGRIDVNAAFEPPETLSDEDRAKIDDRLRQMAAIGYGGNDAQDPPPDARKKEKPRGKDWSKTGDWLHTNAIDYHAELDLIVLSSPELSEVFVIDHSTTSEEARGSTGGRYGKGGDLLWRWGDPAMHGAGGDAERRLFHQHDPTWIDGPAGELRLLVFNNGGERPGGDFSSVDELVLPFDREHGFRHEPGRPFGPAEPVWTYARRGEFFSGFISGARRLASGNTLVTSGAAGRIFEVTPAGEIVWEYVNPHGGDVTPPEHAGRAPRTALFRADRYAPDHPGVAKLVR